MFEHSLITSSIQARADAVANQLIGATPIRMHSQDKYKFSGPCANDAQRFLSISFESLMQKPRFAPSSIGIEIDPGFFWSNQIPDAASPKELVHADKCLKQQHEGTGSVVEPNKAPIEEEKDTNFLR